MTKPSAKDIREAMEWVEGRLGRSPIYYDAVFNSEHLAILRTLRTLRTALEEYKPKTVTRGEVEAITEKIDYIGWPPSALTDNVIGLLKSTGIEVTGEENE